MDIGTLAGLVVAVVAVLMSIILGGGDPAALINVPSIFVVFGGTTGALVCAFPLARITKVHGVVLKAVFNAPPDLAKMIKDMTGYAEVARREGILALENIMGDMEDPFLIRGVKMAIDGTDPELIQTVLDTELEAMMERHIGGKKILDAISKYAPAFGMIGTLLGLIFMLQNMDDPSAIGPGMAVALITTLYGAMISNIAAGPLGDKLVAASEQEVLSKTIIITGVMSIQSGDNPRVVESKLLTFLPPAQRAAFEAEQEAA